MLALVLALLPSSFAPQDAAAAPEDEPPQSAFSEVPS